MWATSILRLFRPEMDSRIYLLDEDDRSTAPDGPAVIGPDGQRDDIPPLVYRAIQHVLEAMRSAGAEDDGGVD
ncbi:hypothetical protein EV651_101380 [Kribbella sp. VKM Ac-2571]|nr:hypothetical protein EV651_101380 [Kribbella sp. VKM Ac-2571]